MTDQQQLAFAEHTEPEAEHYPAPEPDAYGTLDPYWDDQELPRASWCERDGHVFVDGIGFVPGGHRVERIPLSAVVGPYTCQHCKRETYMRSEVALWRRWEGALGRRMYWLGLASDARPRSRCDACEVGHG